MVLEELRARVDLASAFRPIPRFLSSPIRLFTTYDRANLRFDLIAGLTVSVILLPQAVAFSLIAELPPAMGIYTAVVAGFVGALWGSSDQNHTGPGNATSLLVAESLRLNFIPGSAGYILAAGMLAVMSGALQLGLGLARLGMLVNFVSHSVVVGFATGAGILIAIRQIPPLLGLEVSTGNVAQDLVGIVLNVGEIHWPTAALGFGTIALIVVLQKINRKVPAALIAMIISSLVVFALNLEEQGVGVIGELPRGLPPLAQLPLFNLDYLSQLSTGALAVAAIGLVQTMAITHSIATQTGQRLDSNQEFVGQGMANIAAGFFSGFPAVGSFARGAVNLDAGARTRVAAIFSCAFVLIAVLLLGPMTAYLPRTALAGVLVVVSVRMIDRAEIARILQSSLGEATILIVTLFGTVFLQIAFAVLAGILLSFARYILRTSTPRVEQVVPDENFRHFTHQPDKPVCPQLGVVDILGDLYFGAVHHVEEVILEYMERHPAQRYLVIRMHNVNNCDFSGIHMLEGVMRAYRERAGDVFVVQVGHRVDRVMTASGFYDNLGLDHLLPADHAIGWIFHHILDPAICIYECPHRVFAECQNLPKQLYGEEAFGEAHELRQAEVATVEADELWQQLRSSNGKLTLIDVREPREFKRGHVPGAELVPLPKILSGEHTFVTAGEHRVVFVCRSGRRSRRAALKVMEDCDNVEILSGGMLAWEAAGLLEAIDQ